MWSVETESIFWFLPLERTSFLCERLRSRELLGPVSRKSRELFGPEKLVVKLQSTCFEELIFLHVFNI